MNTALQASFDMVIQTIKESNSEEVEMVLEIKKHLPIGKIQNQRGYKRAKLILDAILDHFAPAIKDTKAKRIFNECAVHLASLIENYEMEKYQAQRATPVELLRSFMDDFGLEQKDLRQEIGVQSTVSSILKGDRNITLSMAKRLGKRFKVDPVVFLDL